MKQNETNTALLTKAEQLAGLLQWFGDQKKCACITFRVSPKEFERLQNEAIDDNDNLFHTVAWFINRAMSDGEYDLEFDIGKGDFIAEEDIVISPPEGVRFRARV